jgi:uncharacterized cupin superfamily protein
MTTALHTSTIDWPSFVPIPDDRVRAGVPSTSTLVLHKDDRTELGLWQATPGDFTTSHSGYEEFIHVVDGEGDLVRDDGTIHPLRAGTILLLEDGWAGQWVIRQTLTKSYSIVTSE